MIEHITTILCVPLWTKGTEGNNSLHIVCKYNCFACWWFENCQTVLSCCQKQTIKQTNKQKLQMENWGTFDRFLFSFFFCFLFFCFSEDQLWPHYTSQYLGKALFCLKIPMKPGKRWTKDKRFYKQRCNWCKRKNVKQLAAVGFEPTPSKWLVP